MLKFAQSGVVNFWLVFFFFAILWIFLEGLFSCSLRLSD